MSVVTVETKQEKLLEAGQTAPDFSLKDQQGKTVQLSDFRGKKVVLYFYPKSFSGGCTAEACQFRDSYEDFKAAGAEVIGVSNDSVETQASFASKKRLPFVLLSDPGEIVHRQFGVNRTLGIIRGRATFLIDADGIVRHSFQSMNPTMHMPEALKLLGTM